MGKTLSLCVMLLGLGLGACTQAEDHAPATPHGNATAVITKSILEQSPAKKLSYSLGIVIGDSLADFQEIDLPALFSAIETFHTDKENLVIDKEEARENIMKKIDEQRALLKQQQAEQAETNTQKGEAFLQENATKEGIVTLESGLQYKVLQEGTGATPKETDTVEVHYTGTLIDGKVFDSSIERGAPAVFPVNGVIKGWTEALQQMKVGSKWKLYVPSDLGYGEHGAGRDIGPNAVLLFDVELLGIK